MRERGDLVKSDKPVLLPHYVCTGDWMQAFSSDGTRDWMPFSSDGTRSVASTNQYGAWRQEEARQQQHEHCCYTCRTVRELTCEAAFEQW